MNYRSWPYIHILYLLYATQVFQHGLRKWQQLFAFECAMILQFHHMGINNHFVIGLCADQINTLRLRNQLMIIMNFLDIIAPCQWFLEDNKIYVLFPSSAFLLAQSCILQVN